MFKFIIKFIKKIVFSALFIYTYNSMALPVNISIPFNVITVILLSFFGIPSLFAILFYSFIYIR